jgi:hypothetical protein
LSRSQSTPSRADSVSSVVAAQVPASPASSVVGPFRAMVGGVLSIRSVVILLVSLLPA